MQVQVNTSNGIENKEGLERWAVDYLNEQLARFRQDIMRVEVQLRDTNSGRKGPDDVRCMLEARVTGHEPVAATHHASNQDEAFRGATQRPPPAPRARHDPQGPEFGRVTTPTPGRASVVRAACQRPVKAEERRAARRCIAGVLIAFEDAGADACRASAQGDHDRCRHTHAPAARQKLVHPSTVGEAHPHPRRLRSGQAVSTHRRVASAPLGEPRPCANLHICVAGAYIDPATRTKRGCATTHNCP